jgi:hypothetical protein
MSVRQACDRSVLRKSTKNVGECDVGVGSGVMEHHIRNRVTQFKQALAGEYSVGLDPREESTYSEW